MRSECGRNAVDAGAGIGDGPPVWSILVHGGAGQIDDQHEAAHRGGCRRAAEAGALVLAAGGAALDAAIAAVRVLEEDPTFNAGIGGALDEDGMVMTDAAVFRGDDLGYGAVGAVAGVLHPIDLARAVLDDGKHCLLVGPGALRFARKKGIALVDPARMARDPSGAAHWAAAVDRPAAVGGEAGQAGHAGHAAATAATALPPLPKLPPLGPVGDTVGAVALDTRGSTAAATSTGGLLGKYAGRVGDSPIAGAGTYARNDLGAISATGHGETVLRTVLGFQALLALQTARADGVPPEGVLRTELDRATRAVGGRGGLIAVLPDGRVAWARNTLHMGVAWVRDGDRRGGDF
jgi:beta-aspartyl-peptidase (threonine type)